MDLTGKLQLTAHHVLYLGRVPDDVDVPVSPDIELIDDPDRATAVLVFVRDAEELTTFTAPVLTAARRDDLAWIAYPKARQLGTDLTRDNLFAHLGTDDVRPVRQVSIDDTWSALRLRPA